MSEQESLFEPIDETEYTRAHAQPERAKTRAKRKQHNTDVRTRTAWFKLPSRLGTCTVPTHDEIQDTLTDEEKQYRTAIALRMVFTIGEYDVCRDCYVMGADLE